MIIIFKKIKCWKQETSIENLKIIFLIVVV